MSPYHRSLVNPPIAFAHRGARRDAPENTLRAFQLALELGATGLESDVWLTADAAPVLDHDGFVGPRLRRRTIADLALADLPSHIVTLERLYGECGSSFELSLDIKDPDAAGPVVSVAGRFGEASDRLWLCHPDWRLVAQWRALSDDVHLVDSTRLRRIKEGPERRAAALADAGVDAVNLHHTDWTGGLTTLFHRFGRYCLGWDCQHERVLDAILASGIDAVYSDHVEAMMAAVARRSIRGDGST
ncbi:MAG TPA: glycerophosphodiester phosphodiesterase [Acidimicrobiales bacterium]|nr:glycerophosphodiester phosphodiesterase [Acidimicrobiales bacterium]